MGANPALAPAGRWYGQVVTNPVSCSVCGRTILTGERMSPDARNILSYRLLLRDPAKRGDLRAELATAGDVQELSFYLQDDESEV